MPQLLSNGPVLRCVAVSQKFDQGDEKNLRRNTDRPTLRVYERRNRALCKPRGREDMKHTGFIAGIAITAMTVSTLAAFADSDQGRKGSKMTFEQLDANGDGELTKAELESQKADRFAKIDTNGDGALSAEELQAKAQKKSSERVTKMMQRYDANGDGVLSPDEMPKPRHAGKMFDRIDADGSGTISQDEFDTAKAQMKERGKKKGATEQN